MMDDAKEQLARWLRDEHRRLRNPKIDRLRPYAIAALQGLVSSGGILWAKDDRYRPVVGWDLLARNAMDAAEAMLAEEERGRGG
jgi:hypothetical protein